jgi:AcrR family transcriptional regulator
MTEGSQRARNRWGQGERLRGEILVAAARLLSELGGEEGLSIRGVARAAGIAPASIYQHFSDKSALVEGLIEYESERLATAMAAADAQCPPGAALDRVRAQMRAYCGFAIDNPGHYRLIINNRPAAGSSGPLMQILEQVIAGFERCERAGIRLRVPAQRAAVIVFVGTHGRVALRHAGERPAARTESVVDFVDELVSLVIE